MRVLVTGAGGTVGRVLARGLQAAGHTCLDWDRGAVSPDDAGACAAHVAGLDPDAVVHLALGAEAWAGALAGWCAARARPLVFTSSAMVFGNDPDGPHRPGDTLTGRDDYGRYKARCEDAVLGAHPGATVARIGWQIGAARTGGNDMLEHLYRLHEREGVIRASRRWIPACSFLEDTCQGLVGLLAAPVAGVVHLDANAETGWDFHRLVCALRDGPGERGWRVEACEDYVHDQRLLGEGPRVRSLAERLRP